MAWRSGTKLHTQLLSCCIPTGQHYILSNSGANTHPLTLGGARFLGGQMLPPAGEKLLKAPLLIGHIQILVLKCPHIQHLRWFHAQSYGCIMLYHVVSISPNSYLDIFGDNIYNRHTSMHINTIHYYTISPTDHYHIIIPTISKYGKTIPWYPHFVDLQGLRYARRCKLQRHSGLRVPQVHPATWKQKEILNWDW